MDQEEARVKTDVSINNKMSFLVYVGELIHM